MGFWFGKKNKSQTTANGDAAGTSPPPSAQTGGPTAPPATAASPAASASQGTAVAKPSSSMLSSMNARMLDQASVAKPQVDALNDQIVQAVRLSNAETVAYAPSQIAIGPNMMISQASGLIAQSSAAYFDGVSKLALASQGILLKQMTENLVKENLEGAAEDALGVLATDILLGAAAAIAAAAGALEAESASFAIDKIDQSIAKYSDVMRNRKSTIN